MKRSLFIIVATIISISVLKAQKAGSVSFSKIGEATIDFQTTKGVVAIQENDAFKALRIKTDAPVHIESLSVVYQDGTPEMIPVRYDFKPGIESRDINLQGSKRKIKEVDFIYKRVTNDKSSKATVDISGSK